jgi:hypothetical protein
MSRRQLCFYRAQGTSLTATLARSYTPLYSWASPCIYKRGCPRPSQGTWWNTQHTTRSRGQTWQHRQRWSVPSRSRPRCLATLVTPTTSTPVRDNISHISLLCSILHQPIWAGTRSNKFTSRLTVLAGPKCRQLARQVEARCVLTNTFPLSSRWVASSSLFSRGRCSASGVSSSCPLTAAMTWYSSPRSATATTTVGSPDSGELDDGFPSWQKRNTRVGPATLLAGGGGDGATVAMQEATPCRLSGQSESTTPAPLRGPCQALSSHLRQRRVSLPRNVPTPSGLMMPAPSQTTCWALALYLR